ncbi:MAG: glutamine synthetase family protein [candidate division WOR-3 bacterium]
MRVYDEVINRMQTEGVKFVQLWFSDVLGFIKGLTIPTSELKRAFDDGISFDGSSIQGFARIEESDMIARPDPTTFAELPWPVQGEKAGRMLCDIVTPEGRPFHADPRAVLKRTADHAARMGFRCCVGVEMEFFCLNGPDSPEIIDRSGYFDLTPAARGEVIRHEIISALEKLGIIVENSHHEVSASQHEIDLRYADAVSMADIFVTARFVARQVAKNHGLHVTFMPKPMFGMNGSGMHCHLSLFDKETNLFFNPKNPRQPSSLCRQFVAGLLEHAAEITLVTNQWVNSYKRLVPGYEAPVYICWAHMNRSALVRVPAFNPHRRNAARVEYRSPDPACNPYLAFAVILAAGLDGIERRLKLGPESSNNIYRMTDEEREAAGIKTLPKDLSEAIREAEGSKLVRHTLGEELFGYLIRNKRLEWNDYKAQVTEYEIRRYLPIL